MSLLLTDGCLLTFTTNRTLSCYSSLFFCRLCSELVKLHTCTATPGLVCLLVAGTYPPSRESVRLMSTELPPASFCLLFTQVSPLGFYFQPVSILTLSRCVFSKLHLAGFLLIQSVNMFSFICMLTCLHFYNYRYICKHTILLQEKYISPSVRCFSFSFLEFIIFEHIDTYTYTILTLSHFQRLESISKGRFYLLNF